jgi:hypothetical protein
MIAKNHPMAKIYMQAAAVYAKKKEECDRNNLPMPQFRMTLMAKRKAIEEGAEVDSNIHDHRLLLPTPEGAMQCATVSIKNYIFYSECL